MGKYRYEGPNKSKGLGFVNLLQKIKDQGDGDSESVSEDSDVQKAKANQMSIQKLTSALTSGNTGALDEQALVDKGVTFAETIQQQQRAVDIDVKARMKRKEARAREDAKETRVYAKRAIKAATADVRSSRSRKKTISSDRLFEDKVYLAVLARGINLKKNALNSDVEARISDQAGEALEFLREREEFWDQIEATKENLGPERVCESFRFLM